MITIYKNIPFSNIENGGMNKYENLMKMVELETSFDILKVTNALQNFIDKVHCNILNKFQNNGKNLTNHWEFISIHLHEHIWF